MININICCCSWYFYSSWMFPHDCYEHSGTQKCSRSRRRSVRVTIFLKYVRVTLPLSDLVYNYVAVTMFCCKCVRAFTTYSIYPLWLNSSQCVPYRRGGCGRGPKAPLAPLARARACVCVHIHLWYFLIVLNCIKFYINLFCLPFFFYFFLRFSCTCEFDRHF